MLTTNQQTAVIKIGGDVLLDEQEKQGLAQNIKSLRLHGWRIVILHGGGPQTNQLQEKYGLVANKVAGRRITSEADLKVVKQAIAGEVNVDLTSLLITAGLPAFGCHGASNKLIQAVKRPPILVTGAGDKPIDFGKVGDVEKINGHLLSGLLGLDVIPVIATLGVSTEGKIYNINADTTAVAIAKELKADLLLLTTGVGGIFKDINKPDSRIKQVNREEIKQLINAGIIQDGMIAKVEEAVKLLDEGVKTIAIVAGKNPDAFLAVAQGTGEYGTRIVDK